MFVFRTLVTALAFSAASVYAAPHNLRRRCKHTGSPLSSSASAVVASTDAASVSSSIASITTPSSAPVSSSIAPASTKAATSSAAVLSASASSSTRPSSSSSAAAPANTLIGASTLIRALLPVSQKQFWTTAQGASKVLPMQDSTFRPNDMLKDIAPAYVDHAGKSAMRAHFPKGSFIPSHTPRGGLSFYGPGPANVDLTTAKEVTFGYSVFFPDGFDFVKGGKMPGIYGGDDDEGAKSCSGGRRSDKCFSARFMWRTNGAGELYTYLPPSSKANDNVCNVAPQSHCNPEYGASVGRGAFTFKTGDWNTISQRVRLNDAGKQNGELEVFIEGKSVINVGGLELRDNDAGRIRGLMMQTFFGGADSSWATPKDQDVHFADVSVAITESL